MRRLSLLLLLLLTVAWAEPEVKVETLAQGQGQPVKLGDTVALAYRLTLPDGKLVEETPPDKTFRMTLGAKDVIPGLSQGVVGMKRGETRVVTVPPELGYGSAEMGDIPPNSTLTFEIQLLYIQQSTEEHEGEDHAGHDHEDHAGHDHADHAGHDHEDHAGHDHEDHAGHDHGDDDGHAHADDGHDHSQTTGEYGEDGSLNRPHANNTTRPAIMEYMTRDFFTRPWRYDDAPRSLWEGSAVLTLLALGAFMLGSWRGRS